MSISLLIVDDSSIVRKVLKKTIGLADVEVEEIHEAADGLQALEVFNAGKKVDLMFLDINMPNMNGIELLENIRADERFKNTPVIVISTEGSEERINILEANGIKAFLRKPVTAEQVAECVQNVLEG